MALDIVPTKGKSVSAAMAAANFATYVAKRPKKQDRTYATVVKKVMKQHQTEGTIMTMPGLWEIIIAGAAIIYGEQAWRGMKRYNDRQNKMKFALCVIVVAYIVVSLMVR